MKNKRFFSIRFKWAIFINIGILISLLVTVLWMTMTTSKIIKSDDSNLNEATAQQVGRQVDTEFQSFERSAEQLAGIVEGLVMEKDAIKAIENDMKLVQEKNDQILAAYYMDFQTGKLHISPAADIDMDVRESESYKTLAQKTETQWMDVYQDKISGHMMTSVLSPVVVNGRMVGAVGYDIDLSTIDKLREAIEKDSTQHIIVLDAQGVIVSSFMKDVDGKNMRPANSGKVDGVEDVDGTEKFKETYSWVDEVFDGVKAQSIHLAGEDYQVNAASISDINWRILSLQPERVVQGKIAKIQSSGFQSALIGLVIGLFVALFIAQSITKIIKRFQTVITKTSEGDLVTEFHVKSNDEIGQLAGSFNQMLKSLRETLSQVNDSSEQVAASSQELSASAEENTAAASQVANLIADVTDKIEYQGKNTEESERAIEEITAGIVNIAESASTVADSSVEVKEQAHLGHDFVEKLSSQMNIIKKANNQTNEVIQQLENRSGEIGAIIQVITDIADQTNLLSLNAAIEAARAGEHGKGFAVVADEVRKLAESSRQSAKQISEIIGAIQGDTNRVADMMDNGNKEVDQGMHVATETSRTFNGIISAIEKVNVEIEDLSATSEQLSASVQQVNAAIKEVSNLAQASSSSAEEIAAATEEQLASIEEVTASATELSSMAERLKDVVNTFKIR